MGILLLYAALILHAVLRVLFGWYKPVYYISKYGFKKGLHELNWHYIHQAMAEDQSANVSMFMLMNKFFTKGEHDYNYGDEDDTISYATSMSYWKGKPGGPASGVRNFLCWVDKNHDIKSITSKIDRDIEALERLKASGMVGIAYQMDITEDSWKKYVAFVTNKERKIKL